MTTQKVYLLTYQEKVVGQYASFPTLWEALLEQHLTENLTEGQLDYYLRKYALMRFQSRGRWYEVQHTTPLADHPPLR